MTAPDWFNRAMKFPRKRLLGDRRRLPDQRARLGRQRQSWSGPRTRWSGSRGMVGSPRSDVRLVVSRDRTRPQWTRRQRSPRAVLASAVGAEVVAVSDAIGFPGPPSSSVTRSESLVTMQTAASHGEVLAGAVIVDSPRCVGPTRIGGRFPGRAFRAPGTYPDLDTALEHFHLVPPQPGVEPWVIDHVARNSCTRQMRDGPGSSIRTFSPTRWWR